MGYFPPFSSLDKCRPEAGGDIISGMALDYVGTDVPAGFDDSRLNSGRIIRLCPAGPVLRTFVEYLITFYSRPEAASDVISGMFVGPVVRDKSVKSHDPSLNRSREIPPEAVGGGIFNCFAPITPDRQ